MESQNEKRRFLLVAVSVTLVIVTSVGVYLMNGPSSGSLYNEYYSTSDLPSLVQRNVESTTLEEATLEFEGGDFGDALVLYEKYRMETPEPRPEAYLYEGMSQLELDDFEGAVKSFDRFINSNSVDRLKGLWFKALAYLKAEDIQNARAVLSNITEDSSNFNYQKARKLLEKLN